jgi:hypothetical protein
MNTNIHEPTPEFERFLEWQVTTALRRQERFAEPPRPTYIKYISVAALVLVSILVGAGGVTAASRIQSNEQTKLLLAQQATEILLAQMKVDAAQQAAELAKKRVAVGTEQQATLVAAEQELRLAMLKLKEASLNSEEIGASGKPVQNDLTSPRIGSRDFVAERMRLEQQAAAVAVEAAAQKLSAAKRRFDVGLAEALELTEAQTRQVQAMAEMRAALDKLSLRESFLEGKIKMADVAREKQLLAARSELEIAKSALALATERHERFQVKAKVGMAGEIDLAKSRLEMLSLQQDVVRLEARIRQLQQGR